MKIMVINESTSFKKFLFRGKGGTLGGIETNHVNLMRGLRERGHEIVENKLFPPGKRPDIIISPTYGPYSMISLWWYKFWYRCACVQHAHTTSEDMKGGFLPKSLLGYADVYLRRLYRNSDVLITPSNFSKDSLLQLGLHGDPPIEPVSNGIDLEKFQPSEEKRTQFREYLKEKHGIDPRKVIVGCVSVIWERKGVDVFHEIAQRHPEWEFVWVGNYITAKDVMEKHDDLPNITFTGYVPDVVAAYCGIDVFFFPSRAENQGIPLLEAAACKVPVVCRDLPTYDWIESGVHCLKGTSPDEFDDLVTRLVADKELARKLTAAASKNVQEHDINLILDKVESIYLKAIEINKEKRSK